MASKTPAEKSPPTDAEAVKALRVSLEGGKTTPLADAVESMVQDNHFTFERALSVVDDAIIDGRLTINGAFEVGLE